MGGFEGGTEEVGVDDVFVSRLSSGLADVVTVRMSTLTKLCKSMMP